MTSHSALEISGGPLPVAGVVGLSR
jgi:hypothetical protein